MIWMCSKCGYQADDKGKRDDSIFGDIGRWWHVPCADLNAFPFRGWMIPETIMTLIDADGGRPALEEGER